MLLIKNAAVFDGVNESGVKRHVVIDGQRIADVLDAEPAGFSGEILDAEGLTLSPGFIDTHSHNDFYTVQSDAHRYIKPFVEQGITTQVAGNCGFSTLGIDPETPYGKDLFAFFKENPDYRSVATFGGWAAAVNKYSPVNIACLCGHGTIRTSLRGLGPDKLTPDQMKTMMRNVEEQLEAGAAGVSYGLMYDPSMYGEREELLALARIAAKYGRLITFHARACSRFSLSYPEMFGRAHNLRALDEVIDIAQKSGAKTHVSHIIFVGRSTWSTLDETVRMLDGANASGSDISFDIYSYPFGASTITVALPSWYQGLSAAEKKKPFTQLRLNAEIFATKKLLGFGFNDIQVTWAGAEHPEYVGKRIAGIAAENGTSHINAYLKVIEETGTATTVIMYSYLNDHIIDTLSRHPRVHYMTDAWITENGMQNLASFGVFPRFLRLSREGKAESLGAMLRKMTGAAAERFGLKDRGRIAKGCYADICLFNAETIAESGSETPPVGLPHVLINGQFAVKDGVYQNLTAGQALTFG